MTGPPLLAPVAVCAVLVATPLPGTSPPSEPIGPGPATVAATAGVLDTGVAIGPRPRSVAGPAEPIGPLATAPGPLGLTLPGVAAGLPVPTAPPVQVAPVAEGPAPSLPPPLGEAAVPSPAPAPGPDGTVALDASSGDWLHRRAADALAMISFPWPRLGYEIVFAPARSGLRARVLLRERRIEVYVRPSDAIRQTAFDLAHELAHALDFEHLTDPVRAAWQRARRLDPARPWFGCNACTDLATPAGDFAESFAAWQVPGAGFASRLGPPPDEAQRSLLAHLAAVA